MNVSMATNNGANSFNILAPGENEVALFNGSTSQNQYEGVLPESGDSKIRVYLERSAARRNEVGKYRLEMIVSGDAADVSQADPGEFSATQQSDLNIIRIGKERYEIPDAVISGG